MATRATTQVHIYDTPPPIWDELARVFGSQEGTTAEWVTLDADGAKVTFFKADDEPISEEVS